MRSSSRVRRFLEGTAAVAIWIALGLAFHISANGYLILGVPVTIAFQLYIRRAPLRAMWVRDAPPFRLGVVGVVIAIFLMLLPLGDLVGLIIMHSKNWAIWLWLLSAIAGAWAAAYALRSFRRETSRELLLCLATAGTIGCAIMIVSLYTSAATHHEPASARIVVGVAYFFEYIPVMFFLEEVWFRGVLDSHLHHPGEARGIASAIYVSALWGLWHYPVVDAPHSLRDFPHTIGRLLLVHVLIGTFLSIYWRRSGNLFVTGSVHALIDAVRNALLA